MIPKSQYGNTTAREEFVSTMVSRATGCIVVTTAVNLNGKFRRRTVKI